MTKCKTQTHTHTNTHTETSLKGYNKQTNLWSQSTPELCSQPAPCSELFCFLSPGACLQDSACSSMQGSGGQQWNLKHTETHPVSWLVFKPPPSTDPVES